LLVPDQLLIKDGLSLLLIYINITELGISVETNIPILLSVPELRDGEEGEENIPAGTRLNIS